MNSPSYRLRTLQRSDAEALLRFELENRSWFERFVAPRAESFYSPAGVEAHIDEALRELELGRYHPQLLLDEAGEIVGRVNLKDIDALRRTAEVGYRIGQAHAGRGAASAGLLQLISTAQLVWGLDSLEAVVAEGNPASARVLEKAGFVCVEQMAELATIAGQRRSGRRFRRPLSAATAD